MPHAPLHCPPLDFGPLLTLLPAGHLWKACILSLFERMLFFSNQCRNLWSPYFHFALFLYFLQSYYSNLFRCSNLYQVHDLLTIFEFPVGNGLLAAPVSLTRVIAASWFLVVKCLHIISIPFQLHRPSSGLILLRSPLAFRGEPPLTFLVKLVPQYHIPNGLVNGVSFGLSHEM